MRGIPELVHLSPSTTGLLARDEEFKNWWAGFSSCLSALLADFFMGEA